MLTNVILTSFFQIMGDIICAVLSTRCAIFNNPKNRFFFTLSAIAFFILAFGDIYYNYMYRIQNYDIKSSTGITVILPVLIFQLLQATNWFLLIKKQHIKFISLYNLPYLLFAITTICILLYYFFTGNRLTVGTTWYQSASISLNMLIWVFAIICLSRTTSLSIKLLTLGCLILISADLTIRCLFMFQIDIVSSVRWVHIVWVLGVWCMLFGLIYCLKNKPFEFCHDRSIQSSCSTWMSTTSLIAFLIGFLFLSFLKLQNETIDMHLLLWNLPIVLMFTMITSVLLGNWFSSFILIPIRYFMDRISSTNTKRASEKPIFLTRVHEFEVLNNFIDHALDALFFQLERETKLAAQVAHDIRSPLIALDMVVKRMPEVEEPKRILLRGALNHIKNIVENLEKKYIERNHSEERTIIQVIAILDYVLWERQEAFSEKPIEFIYHFDPECYKLFVNVIPTELKRILTNIINNAREAINLQNGKVSIHIGKEDDQILISISDNGEGIPKEILNSIFDQGFTTKQHGSGLGLYHAKEWLTKWSGSIELRPNTSNGCKVHIRLPSNSPPPWFVEHLVFNANDTVICVDDNVSIFHAWQEQFQSIGSKINLRYCHNKDALISEIKTQGERSCTYLIDYEFSEEAYTGIELANLVIALNNPNNRIFLVTSHSNEPKLQRFCEFHKIGIIPKLFAFKIPLTITHFESIQGGIHVY